MNNEENPFIAQRKQTNLSKKKKLAVFFIEKVFGLQIVVEIKRVKVKRSVVGPRRRLRGARVQLGGARVPGGRART